MTVEQVFGNLRVAVITGIGFGSAYPELTEQLWSAAYERPVDDSVLSEALKAGLDLGGQRPEPIPLAKREEQLMLLVKLFVSESRPELLSQF